MVSFLMLKGSSDRNNRLFEIHCEIWSLLFDLAYHLRVEITCYDYYV